MLVEGYNGHLLLYFVLLSVGFFVIHLCYLRFKTSLVVDICLSSVQDISNSIIMRHKVEMPMKRYDR